MLRLAASMVLSGFISMAGASQCHTLGDASARLECYDALSECRLKASDEARLACYDAAESAANRVPQPAPVAPVASASARANQVEQAAEAKTTPAPANEAAFGLPAKTEAPDEISSRIKGAFDGFRGKAQFELENGQVWELRRNMGNRSYKTLENPRIVISRNMLGFFVMSIPDVNLKLPVRRVR